MGKQFWASTNTVCIDVCLFFNLPDGLTGRNVPWLVLSWLRDNERMRSQDQR